VNPVVLYGFDDERTKIRFDVPVKGRKGPAQVHVPRFDYIDEDTFDAIMAELEAMDVEQQLCAVANDVAAAGPGVEVTWEPLLEDARTQLTQAGAVISRRKTQDVITAPDQSVVDHLAGTWGAVKPLPFRKRSRQIALAMLRHVVTDDEYQWFEALPSGDLDKMLTAWKDASTITLGESGASSTS